MDDFDALVAKYSKPEIPKEPRMVSPYDGFIEESASKHGVDPDLIRLQMGTESAFKPKARSPKGASGLMQLMPATAKNLGVKNIYDPKENIEGGVKYMRQLLDMFGGDVNLALAGYNAGEGAVQKYGNKIPPYKETQNYVKKITGNYKGKGYRQQASFDDLVAKYDVKSDFDSLVAKYQPEDTGTIYGQPADAYDPTNPPPPALETDDTILAQLKVASDTTKPRKGVFFPANDTERALQIAQSLDQKEWGLFPDKQNKGYQLVHLPSAKKLKLRSATDIQTYIDKNPNALVTLTSKAYNAGRDTGGNKQTVSTIDPQTGVELTSSVVTPATRDAQVALDKANHPDGVSVDTTTDAVVEQRLTPIADEYGNSVPLDSVPQNPDDLVIDMGAQFGIDDQPAMPDAPVAQATDADFNTANEYLKSVGQPLLTREQFDVAQKTVGKSAQATGYATKAPQMPVTQKGKPPVIAQGKAVKPPTGTQSQKYDNATYELPLSNKNGSYKSSYYDEVASRLSSELNVPYEVARSVVEQNPIKFTDGGEADEDYLAEVAKAGKSINAQIGGTVKRQILDAAKQVADKQKVYREKLDEYAKSEAPSVADLMARKDAGLGVTDDQIKAERDAYQKALEEKGLTGTVQDPYAAGIASGELSPESRRAIRIDINAANADLEAKRQKFAQDILKDSGSFVKYQKDQQRVKDEYANRPLAEPLEFAKNLAGAIPKALASVLKTGDLALNMNPLKLVYDQATGRGFKIDETGLSDIGNNINQYIEKNRNPDLKDKWYINMLPDTIGQLATQITAGVLTGGATVPTLIGASMGAAAQYDEAKKFNADDKQKMTAAIVGALAAIPDALLFSKWFKGADEVAQTGFIKQLTQSLMSKLGVKYGEEVAAEVTKASIKQFASNILKNAGFEGLQEVSENKINDWLALNTFDPSAKRREKLLSISDDDVSSFLGGLIGGAGGGAIETYTENLSATAQEDLFERSQKEVDRLLEKGEITPAKAAEIKAVVAQAAEDANKGAGKPAVNVETVAETPKAEKPKVTLEPVEDIAKSDKVETIAEPTETPIKADEPTKPIDISPVRERAKAKAAEKFGVKGEAVDEKVDAPTATDNVRKSYATENTELEEIHPNANKLDEFSRSVRLTEKEVEKHVSSATIKKNSKGKFETSVWPGKTFDSKEDAVNAIRESASHIMRVPRFLPEDYVDFLDDPDRSIRQRVVDSPQATEEALIKALNDPIPEIRNRALYNPNATKEVFRLARENDIKDVRLTAKREGAKRFAPSAQPKAEAVKEPIKIGDNVTNGVRDGMVKEIVADKKYGDYAVVETANGEEQFSVAGLDRVKAEAVKEPTREEAKAAYNQMVADDIARQQPTRIAETAKTKADAIAEFDYTEPQTISDDEVIALKGKDLERYNARQRKLNEIGRRKLVKQAIADGKTVPQEVLADYPDLARLATRKAERATNLEAAKAKVAERKEAVEARRAKPTSSAAIAENIPTEPITDFGERIGGARKDLDNVVRTGGKSKSDAPAWMKDYHVGELKSGKFQPFRADSKSRRISWRSHQEFDTKEQAIDAIKAAYISRKFGVRRDGETYSVYRKVTNKKFHNIKEGFATLNDAGQYLIDNTDELLAYKPQFPERPHIEDLQRTGPDYRNGKNVSTKDFVKEFGFTGGEFGNWVPQDERQRLLNFAFDGLHDLADLLGVPPTALSLNGQLSIAFGSRGQGLKGAAAHYERDRAVFNLTRMNGAGSVAHEWFHALDHYFGAQDKGDTLAKNEQGIVTATKGRDNDFLSHGSSYKSQLRPETKAAFKDLIATIYKQPKIVEVSVERYENQTAHYAKQLDRDLKELSDYLTNSNDYTRKKAGATPAQTEQIRTLVKRIQDGDVGEKVIIPTTAKFAILSTYEAFNELNNLAKEIRGHSEFRKDSGRARSASYSFDNLVHAQQQLAKYKENNKEEKVTPTRYHYDARDLDRMRSSDYWSTEHEMAARAFEAYIEDQLEAKGDLSQYLVHSTQNSVYKKLFGLNPYPEGKERTAINQAFEKFFNIVEAVDGDNGNVALRSIPETDPLQGIITDRGIDYERAKDVAGRIERGEYSIERLGNAGEQGRIRGGRENVIASVILGASEAEHQAASRRGEQGVASRSSEIRRQENILERYAREAGIWLDPKFTNRQTRVGAGGEAVVYHKDGDSFVTKVVDYRHINRGTTPLEFLDRTSLFNALFPEAPYTLEGVTRIDGKLRFVIKQPYVNGGGVQHSVFADAMADRGWKPLERESYENSLYQVFDLHEKNVMQDADGNFYVIDAVPRAKHTQEFAIVRNDRSAYNADGDIDYAEVTDTAKKVISGVHSIKRLTPAGEEGRVRSGQRGVEASIVVGTIPAADTVGGAGARKVAEEQALEKYAKHEGVWFDYNQLVNKDLTYFAQGTEAKVYRDENDPGFVTKLAPIPVVFGADSSVLRFLDDKLGIHNSLPFTAPYELVGFTRDDSGTFLAVLRQPLIQGKEITAPVAEFSKAMQSEGLLPRVGGGYQNSQFKVLDIDDHNVIQSADGKFHIIDPIVSYADDAMYQPFTVVRPDEALRSVADTPAFAKWFGDSKVVDSEGKPLVVYHGTNQDVDSFSPEKRSSKTGNVNAQLGHFFTDNKTEASRYAADWGKDSGNVMPVFLSIQNPYVMPYREINYLAMGEFNRWKEGATKDDLTQNREDALNEVRERRDELIAEGYDGVITKIGGKNEYIAFEPTQIKSAIGNNGNFDPTDPSILRKVAEPNDIADIEALGKGDFKELFNDIKSDVKSDATGANILDLGTNKTIELVRTAFAYMYDTPLEGTAIPGGMYLDPSQTNDFRDALQGIADAASEAGIESKGVDTLIKNLDKAAKDGDVRVIGFDNTLKHETGHQQSNRGAVEKSIAKRRTGLRELADGKDAKTDEEKQLSQSFRTAFGKWNDLEKRSLNVENATPSQLGQAAEEIAMYIADGQHTRLGLSYAKAIKLGVELQLRYAEARIQENPKLTVREALATFEGTILQPFSEQVYEREQSGKSNQSNVESKGTGRENDQGNNARNTQSDGDGVSSVDTAKQKGQKPRRTIESANLAGITTQEGELYPVKSVEGNKREAQTTIEDIGLTNAINQASVPIVETDENSLRRHVSLQMQTAETVFEQELKARAEGNDVLADAYKLQKETIISALATQGTDTAQALRQFGEWRIFNPETVDLFINLRRNRRGMDAMGKEESAREESQALRDAEEKVRQLEAKIEQDAQGKQSYESDGKKTKPLTKTEKKILDGLKTRSTDALQRLGGDFAFFTPTTDSSALRSIADGQNMESVLDKQKVDDLTEVGARMLMEGWHGDVLTPEQFETNLRKVLRGKFSDHYKEIHALSIEKMDKLIKDARHENAANAIKADKPNATDAEIEKILAEKEAEQKANNAIRAEHRKLAKEFLGANEKFNKAYSKQLDITENFIRETYKISPDVDTEVMAGALARLNGAFSEQAVQKYLRETFPEKFKFNASDTTNDKRQKFHDLSQAVAESEKLYRETAKALREQRRLELDGKKGISPEMRKELDAAKTERRIALNNLSAKVDTLTQPDAGPLRTTAHTQRGLMVMALRTAITNWWSTGIENMAVNKPITVGTILGRKAGLRGEENGLTADASILTALMTPKGATDIKGLVKETVLPMDTMDLMLKIINDHPEYYGKFFGDFSPDYHTGVSKTLDKFMGPMRWQEFNKRGSKAANALALRASMKGVNFRKAIQNDDFSWVDKSDMDFALNEAKALTYALKPKKGTGSVNDEVFARIGEAIQSSGVMDLLGANTIPFNNFVYNIINKSKTRIPGIAQARTAGKIVQRKRADGSSWGEATKNTLTAENVSNQVYGLIAAAIFIAAVRSLGDRDEWYYFAIPFTKGMGRITKDNPNGYYYFDIRSQPQLAPFAFIANKLNRVANGKDMFTYGDGSPMDMTMLGELAEGFAGISYRGTSENQNILNGVWNGLQSPVQTAKWITGSEDKESDPGRKGELAAHYLSKALGAQLGTATNIFQGQTIKAILQQFDEMEQHPLNLDAHPLFQQLDSKFPESRRILQAILKDVKPQQNYATGEMNSRNPLPILKVLGFTIYDGADLRREPTQAEMLAAKARFTSDYKAPVLADEKRVAAIKRDFRNAGEGVNPMSMKAEALRQKLKAYENELSPGELASAKRNLFTTSLEENFKAIPIEKTYPVWDAMTDTEKEKILDDYRIKLIKASSDATKKPEQRSGAVKQLSKIGIGSVESLLKDSSTKQWTTDNWAAVVGDKNLSPEDRKLAENELLEKAGKAIKSKTLTPSELANIKIAMPSFDVNAAKAAGINNASVSDKVKDVFSSLGIPAPNFGDSLTPVKGAGKQELSPELKAKYERETYERIDAKVNSLMTSTAYKNADDALRKKMVEGIIRKQRAEEAAETKKEMATPRKLADMSYAKNNGRDFEPEYNDSREKWKGMRQSENVIDRREDAPLTQFMRDLNGGLDTIQQASFTGGTLAERREARKMLREQIEESRYVLKNKKADPQQARAVLKALLKVQVR